MASKRIYQLAKEFERDEKEIIAFLTSQGIKVSNKLSAVNEDTYNLLKAKYTAPPEPEPEPEPEPAPAEPVANGEQESAPVKKKKKKKNKNPQLDGEEQPDTANQTAAIGQPQPTGKKEKELDAAQLVNLEAIKAGNAFIEDYNIGRHSKRSKKRYAPHLYKGIDTWDLLQSSTYEFADTSPVRYYKAANKMATKGLQLIQAYGSTHKEKLAALRNVVSPLGAEYVYDETFTGEENLTFEMQQKFLYKLFDHGMEQVNDRLFDLKKYCERNKVRFERIDFVEYLEGGEDAFETQVRVPFNVLVENIAYSMRGIVRHLEFYLNHKKFVVTVVKEFFEWREGYKTLKQQGADAAKLEKYLELEQKLVDLFEFVSFDNLLYLSKNPRILFNEVLEFLKAYRDDIDNPDAERNFKYKILVTTFAAQKPKEFIFLKRFGELDKQKDYRPLEEIAAEEEAARAESKAATEAAKAAKAAKAAAESTEEKNPADNDET